MKFKMHFHLELSLDLLLSGLWGQLQTPHFMKLSSDSLA